MSLFSRIDRIRGGRGSDDREDDSVFAIPDLSKSAPRPSAPSNGEDPAPQPEAPSVASSREQVSVFTPSPIPSAQETTPSAEASAPKPKKLSPLERLARRTAGLEDDTDGDLPDPVMPDRPATSNLAERLGAEPLPDDAAPNGSQTVLESMAQDEVPVPHAPFRRPSLLNKLSGINPSPDDAAPPVAAPEAQSEDEVAQPTASDESVTPVAAPVAQLVTPAPASPISAPPSGGTAFDRLMAARAGTEGGRTTPTLAERLAVMRAESEAQSATSEDETPDSEAEQPEPETSSEQEKEAPVEASASEEESAPREEIENVPAPETAAVPSSEITYDPEASLEDVLAQEQDGDAVENTPVEAGLETDLVEDSTDELESAQPEAIVLPASSLDAPVEALAQETAPDPETAPAAVIEEPTTLQKETIMPQEQMPAASSSAPPVFAPVEIPPAPAVMKSSEAPPLPWEVDPEPESQQAAQQVTPQPEPPRQAAPVSNVPLRSGWRDRLSGAASASASAPAPAPVVSPVQDPPQSQAPAPATPTPSAPTSLWAQRLAGRDALRDAPAAQPAAIEPAPVVPASAGMTSEAIDRAPGQLARTGGEGVSGEGEARNRSLYRQKHFIFDAVLGSLDGRTLQNPTRDTVKPVIERAVDSAMREFNLSLDTTDRAWMIEEFIREVVDLGPLVGLLEEVSVNKILVVGSTDVAVERLGRIERTGISFRDDDHLMTIVRRIADITGGRIDAKVPLLDRPLPDGARIRAKIPPLAPQPTLTVEKSTGNPFTALKRQQAERGRENALPYSQLRERIQQRLLREFEGNAAALANPERLRTQVEEMIGLVIAEEKVAVSRAERASLVMELLNEIVGLGPIEPLLNDPEVDEVMVNGPYQIYVERKGKLEISGARFRDNNHVMQVIERIVAPLGRRVDEKSPMVDGRLRDGSRFNAIIPPLALSGPTMTIRKFARDPFTMTDLINFGSMSREAAQFLQAAVEGRMNIIVSGGTGSGKTTTLNVLSSFIPASDRIVTIEDAAELQLRQEHVVRLETRPPNIEGAGEIAIRDLVRNSLRMRPDRIVVGECRGGEALDMLQAMNTGHDGSLTTAHSNGPRDTVKRLETMVMMAGFDLPIRAIREQISMAVQFIVHQERMRDGKRRVTAVTELVGMEGDVVTMQDIFRFEQDRIDDEGRIIGVLAATGLRPQNFDNIVDHGVNLSMDLFQPRTMSGRDGDLRSRLSDHRIGTR